ncbi:MAG TPA: hypothetical protein VGG99_06755 [Acetobacteraceae bacterium]|jgi:hypothetical protein
MPDRWHNLPPVALVPTEATFNWFVRQLMIGGALSRSEKGKALVGIVGGMAWQAGGIAAYVVTGECRGLMQFTIAKDSAEIEQWVTAANARGIGTTMLEWLVNKQGARTVSLFPIAGVAKVYENLGFVAGKGGYMTLTISANNPCWADVSGVWKCFGPPPPPPS